MQTIEKMSPTDLALALVAAEDQVVRVLTAAKVLATRIKRVERESYLRGFEAGVASGHAAAAAEARRIRRSVERDSEGRITGIVDDVS